MKKKIFTLVLLSCFACGLLTACNSPSNISGQFNKENYIVSVDDTINFLEELSLKGIEKAGVSLSSSNEVVMKGDSEGRFTAKASGETYIFAKTKNKVIAKTKVNVKYKFSSPKNINIDENGVLTWDKSFAVKNNQTSFANQYRLTYSKYKQDNTLGDKVEKILAENTFTFTEVGSYKITLEALVDVQKDIDGSKVVEKVVNNGVMPLIDNASLTLSEEIGSQKATLVWAEEDENTLYDVYIEGFKMFGDLSQPSFEYDYSFFGDGDAIEVTIISKDGDNKKHERQSVIVLNKLSATEIEYGFNGLDGLLTLDFDVNASACTIKVTDFEGQSKTKKLQNSEELVSFLSELEGGAYNIEAMAIGQSENGLYLNSNKSETMTFAKIQTPNVVVKFVGKTAEITFDESEYSNVYRIKYGQNSKIHNTDSGLTTTIDLSRLEVGSQSIEIVALPKSDATSQTGASEITYGEVSTPRVINSNAFRYDFFVLEEINSLTHNLSGTTSTISFDEVENANTFTLYVNGILIEDVEMKNENKVVSLSFENLNKIDPINGKYTFKVICDRIEEEKQKAICVEKTKTIEILSVVTEATNQTNGYFAWNEVSGQCEYYYEVYKTDKNYQVLTPDAPTLSGTTSVGVTDPQLELGAYYTIKIYTNSTNTNEYLDANFADENAYFTQNFIATKEIEKPLIKFFEEEGKFKLEINSVEYGGKYEIFVDGLHDGEIIVGQPQEKYVYQIANPFEDAGVYDVTVVASCGLLYDQNLYLPSQEASLTVERLAQAEFSMDYVRDIFDRKTNENLILKTLTHSKSAEVKLNNEVVLDDGYVLDLMDYSKFGSEFTLKVTMLAQDSIEDEYYINSLPIEFKFQRAIAPSSILFDSGFVRWENKNQEPIDYFEGVLTLVNSNSANYYVTFQISNEKTEYDIQTLIDRLTATNPSINSAYRQAEKLQVQLYSFSDGENDDIYKLPSENGTTTKGENVLDILTLEKPVLTYDPETKTLSWTEEHEASIYDIYVDDQPAVVGHTTNSILLSGLGTYDYLIAKKIKVKAYNSEYLDSEFSDEISIEQISINNSLAIAKNGLSYKATFAINADQTYIEEVWVNESKANVEYETGASVASFDFAKFAGENQFTILLKAKNQSTTHYYLDSEEVTFTVTDLSTVTLTHEVQVDVSEIAAYYNEEHLIWGDVREDLKGNSIQPIVYTVYVTNGGNTYDFTSEECDINLEKIEEFINASLSGSVKIKVVAKVEKDYTLTGTDTFGYYGETSTKEEQTSKLAQGVISDILVYEETRNTSPLKQKMFAGLEIIFEDDWSGEGQIFYFAWEDQTNNQSFIYSFAKEDLTLENGAYHAYICISDYNAESLQENFFIRTPQNVSFEIKKDGAIDSNATEFTVNRFDASKGSKVSDEGVLTVGDTQENASYLLELKISDKVIYKPVLASKLNSSKEIDLMTDDFFGGIEDSGAYELSIVVYDENEKILPSATAEVISGYRLAGIDTISIDDDGNINFNLLFGDYDNIVFTARNTMTGKEIKKDFDAQLKEDSVTEFYISMIGLLKIFEDEMPLTNGEYTFEFTVRQEGSINASWVSLTFGYSNTDNPTLIRGRELEHDYILFAVDGSDISTTAFRIDLTGYFADEIIDEGEEEIPEENLPEDEGETGLSSRSVEINHDTRDFYFYPQTTRGYWVTDLEGNNGYFAREKGSEANLIYTEYYVVSIRTLLETIAYGDVEIKISRVGKNDKIYYQFNENEFNLYKLNKINDDALTETDIIRIEDNYLYWSWNQKDSSAQNIKPSAFYVMFEDVINTTSKKYLVTAYGLDLRTIELQEGYTYNVSVIAINYNTSIVASNNSMTIETMKYATPISLNVVDGKLVYDPTQFLASDFMQDIVSYFGQASPAEAYHNMVGLKTYNSPFTFAPQTFENTTLRLKFARILEGGVTNEYYTGDFTASSLIPNIEIPFASTNYATTETISTMRDSFKDLLGIYQSLMLASADTIEATNTNAMIDAIKHSNCGIGDGVILIDDIGRNLPAGEYLITVAQIGEANYIESEKSQALKVYISASPELSLQTEVSNGSTSYTAIVAPTMNMVDSGNGYTKQLATRYKMQLRYPSEDSLYTQDEIVDFIIEYNSTSWSISYNGTNLPNVISNVSSTDALPKFKLNMNELRRAMEEIGKGDRIEVNTLYTVNIFAYAQDDGYVINGKSAKFEVRYLDLKTEEISFHNGEFVINASLNDNYEMLIKYKLTSQTESSIRQNFQNGEVRVKLDKSGVYEYVVLALNGSISPYTINIASDAYVIKGLYKLNSPSLTTKNNNLSISYNPNDIRYMSTLKFNLANNISLDASYSGEDSGYYYQSDLTSVDSVVPYIVGTNGLYRSELSASRFYAYLNGNSGTFAVSDEEVSEGDILLVFSEGRAIMSSPVSSIDAIMLPSVENILLYAGDFYFDSHIFGIDKITNSKQEHLSGNIVYEMLVQYYGVDNTDESGNTLMKLYEETHYSERVEASDVEAFGQLVTSKFISTEYEYFTLTVSILGALKVDENTTNAIKTIEGTYILLTDSVFYGANPSIPSVSYGQHVLRSPYVLTRPITRTMAPYLEEESSGIMNGAIHFVIDRSLFYANKPTDDINQIAQDTANRISITATYNYGGGTVTEFVSGSASFQTSSELGKENNVYVAVTPSEGLFRLAMDAISFSITIYGNSAITSVPLVIDNVYKLPQVTEQYYEIELVGEKTYLNFTKYFESVSIANDFSCYKVVIRYMLEGDNTVYSEELYSTSPIKRFELYSDATILSIQARDGQDYTTLNPKKLLYSDSTTIEMSKTDIEGLSVKWNAQNMRFEWEWEDGREDEYEYYISLYVSGKHETEIVTTFYYMPQNRGIISSGGFEIRARKKDSTGGTIYSFSDRLVYNGDDISYSLFSGGNGSASNPYIIANSTDFANMSKRNTLDKQFYFKLDNNISISVQDLFTEVNGTFVSIMPEFYGVLDGNGYKLTISSSTTNMLSQPFSSTLTGMNSSLNFDQYSSLFHSISSVATIKNLYLDYAISYNGLNGSTIMFSPISAYNYGTIDNVHLTAFAISTLSGNGENNVFVGGIVGVNYGTIKNCANTASFAYSMAQQLSLNFGYGGICLFNDNKTSVAGTIENCFNQGEKQVTVTVNNNLVYMAGIALTNGGKISTCGNDGSLKLNARGAGVTTFTGYYAGIVISSNGKLEYLYNNGMIENLSTYGTLNYGGIAYVISGGTINTLVVTIANQPIVKNCTSRPNSLGNNYASGNSGTHTFITTKELVATNIDCQNGFILSISALNDGFIATIAKA